MPDFANFQHRSLCSSLSTFTQKLPDVAIASQVVEPTCGRNPTIGGSSETDVNEPMVKPCGFTVGVHAGHDGDPGGEVADDRAEVAGVETDVGLFVRLIAHHLDCTLPSAWPTRTSRSTHR